MATELSAFLDSLGCGLLEARRRVCSCGSLLACERSDALGHIKIAHAALLNLRRIFRRVEECDASHDVGPPSNVIPLRSSIDIGQVIDKSALPEPNLSVITYSRTLNHGPSAAEWRAVHEEIKHTDAMWHALAFEGVQSDGRGGLLEYRRCPRCSSTLARQISREDAIELCRQSAGVHARSLEALASAPVIPPRQLATRKG